MDREPNVDLLKDIIALAAMTSVSRGARAVPVADVRDLSSVHVVRLRPWSKPPKGDGADEQQVRRAWDAASTIRARFRAGRAARGRGPMRITWTQAEYHAGCQRPPLPTRVGRPGSGARAALSRPGTLGRRAEGRPRSSPSTARSTRRRSVSRIPPIAEPRPEDGAECQPAETEPEAERRPARAVGSAMPPRVGPPDGASSRSTMTAAPTPVAIPKPISSSVPAISYVRNQ